MMVAEPRSGKRFRRAGAVHAVAGGELMAGPRFRLAATVSAGPLRSGLREIEDGAIRRRNAPLPATAKHWGDC